MNNLRKKLVWKKDCTLYGSSALEVEIDPFAPTRKAHGQMQVQTHKFPEGHISTVQIREYRLDNDSKVLAAVFDDLQSGGSFEFPEGCKIEDYAEMSDL